VLDVGAGSAHNYVLDDIPATPFVPEHGLVSRDGAADILITEIGFPALDASSKDASKIRIRGTSPGTVLTTVHTGSGSALVQLGDTSQTLAGLHSPLSIQGGGSNTTLAGPNQASVWRIAGPNAGFLANSPVSFNNVPNLSGGIAANAFQCLPFGSLSGTITGGAGSNTLDYSGFTGDVAVNLLLGQATNIGHVTNIQNVTGSSGNSLIVGGNVPGILIGGTGRNLLIGHSAGSELHAVSGRDTILIGGATDFDVSPTALNALMQEWTSSHTAFQRRNFLTTGGGFNGPFRLNPTTVHANGSYSLFASLNPTVVDWLFFHSFSDVKQSEGSDFFTTI
jgi:hypothetical protein